ncbi:AraC family transcriptional regulator [Polaribacter porphyrae]|nr:AraC family transcriptional regulator [Polaribacter porphyrae]
MKNNKNLNKYYQTSFLDGLEILYAKSCTTDFPPHSHSTYNISLILKNTFKTRLEDKILQAPVGTICITNADEVHATPCDSIVGNSFFTFYISSDLMIKLNNNQDLFFNEKVIYNQDVFKELYFLASNFNKMDFSFESRLKLALKRLISRNSDVEKKPYKKSNLYQNLINNITFDDFRLDDVASQFGVNKYKFIRLFKQETGLTPNNFVLLKKIEMSKEMLKKGNSIFDVAIDCGFYDNSHFYKNFKRFIGVNPLEFQNAFLSV